MFQLGEIKQARALSTEITAQGAFLYDLLAKEAENKVSCYVGALCTTFTCLILIVCVNASVTQTL